MSLPVGVIEPFAWGDGSILCHGYELRDMIRVEAAIVSAMREYGIVGCAVAICDGDKVVFAKGFGFAELPDRPFFPSTPCRCASLSKPLTALCALHLMSKGRFWLDDIILPVLARLEIRPVPIDERVWWIKIRQLMDHTSGLSQSASYTAWRPERNLTKILRKRVKTEDVVCDALAFPLDSEPGTKYQYANANFVILARMIACRTHISFNDYLTKEALPDFGVKKDAIYVSKDQVSSTDLSRGWNEAAYYQTSTERYGSFLLREVKDGAIYGEAYRGFSTECCDGGGGIAASAEGLATVIANLHSLNCAISPEAMQEILTPPSHYPPGVESFYSKGFVVRPESAGAWFSHAGMTNHCGGIIGEAAGYQFVAVSNWNNAQAPYVDVILNKAISEALSSSSR